MALTKVSRGLLSTGIVDNSNATAITIDSSENVGIGTSSPSTKLHLGGTAPGDSIIRQDSTGSGTNWEIGEREAGKWQIFEDDSDSVVATFTSTGNVGIGTSTITNPYSQTPFTDVNINGTWGGVISFQLGGVTKGWVGQRSSGNEDMVIGATAGQELLFYENNVEAARISSGNLLVGTTNASQSTGIGVKIEPTAAAVSCVGGGSSNSTNSYHMYSQGVGYRFYVGYGGQVYAVSTSISAISDIRYKENVRDLDDGLSKIMALQPRKFDWKEGKGRDVKNDRGWIAQEIETVFPDLVDEWLDESPEGEEPYKSVRPDLIPVLVKAMQEQQAIIEALTQRIETLENN